MKKINLIILFSISIAISNSIEIVPKDFPTLIKDKLENNDTLNSYLKMIYEDNNDKFKLMKRIKYGIPYKRYIFKTKELRNEIKDTSITIIKSKEYVWRIPVLLDSECISVIEYFKFKGKYEFGSISIYNSGAKDIFLKPELEINNYWYKKNKLFVEYIESEPWELKIYYLPQKNGRNIRIYKTQKIDLINDEKIWHLQSVSEVIKKLKEFVDKNELKDRDYVE